MSVEVYDNRQSGPLRAFEPIIQGDVSKITSWPGSTIICITLDSGYRIILPKSLVPELVKAAGVELVMTTPITRPSDQA